MVPLIRLYVLREAAVRGDWRWLQATRPDAAGDFESVRRVPSRINPSLYGSMGAPEGEGDRFAFWHDVPGLPTSHVLASCGSEGVHYLWDGSRWTSDPGPVTRALALVRTDRPAPQGSWRDVVDVSDEE